MSATTHLESVERREVGLDTYPNLLPTSPSAVSWGAILAGAAGAAALSLILLILGVGLGLSSVSPWSQEGIRAESFGVSTIAWLTFTQLLASGLGGYLAGRLRSKWMGTHTDEIYFRDTAHGFLAWAMASLATATLLTSVIGSILSGGIHAGASVVGGAVSTATVAGNSESLTYFVDALFRPDATATTSTTGTVASAEVAERATSKDVAEVRRIFMNVSRTAPLPPEDSDYVEQLISQRTGLSPEDAKKRVSAIYARVQTSLNSAEVAAKDAADKARKASAYAALWIFVSLLVGAFIASLSATYGGRRRDA